MKLRPARFSLRTLMTLMVLVMAIASLYLVVKVGIQDYYNALDEAERDSARLTNDIVSEFSVLVNSVRELGETLSLLPDIHNRNSALINPLLAKFIATNPVYANIVMLDDTGKPWASGIPLKGRQYSMSDRKYFRDVMTTGRFSFGEFTIGKTTSLPVLAFGYPLKNAEGKLTGCIAIGFNLEYFNQTFKKAALPDKATLLLLDHKGTILYRIPSPKEFIGRPHPFPDVFKAMRTNPAGKSSIEVTVDGSRNIISSAAISLQEGDPPYLYVRSGIPYDSIVSKIRINLAAKFLLLLSIMILITASIWSISRRFIVNPVNELTGVITRMSEGDLSARTSGHFMISELDKIGQSIDILAGKLAESIEERRDAAERLQASERRFKELIRHSSDSVTLLDKDGMQIFVSDVVERMLGYTPSELINIMPIKEMIHPDDQEHVRAAFEKILREGQGGAQYRHRHKNGSWVHLEAWGTNQLDNPDIQGVVINVRDITDRKRAEEEQQKLQLQLLQSQKMESVGRLAGGVAHDFNNKLAIILGYLDMTLMKISPDHPLIPNLMEIRKATESSADLTRQLLAFARRQTISPRVLDLNKTVEGILNMLQRLIGEDITLIWEPGKDLWQIKMDPGQIDQILANLCVNARDAIAGIGKITITTKNSSLDADYGKSHENFSPGEYVLLQISDTGSGMDGETLSNIFEPFFTTKQMGRGTGLGLATVYGIVKQNNGLINVYSELGHGTIFNIYLPRCFSGEEDSQSNELIRAVKGGNETILLVEDDSQLLKMTSLMLESMGYRILSATSPGIAMQLAREYCGKIHLLMTDVIMPDMNGRDLAVKLMSLCPGIKCLFMSGYTADIIANQGMLDAGVNFIQKPFATPQLAEAIRTALES